MIWELGVYRKNVCRKNIGRQQLGHTGEMNSEEDVNAHLPHVPKARLACGHQNLVVIGLLIPLSEMDS